jgi:hypothetical protein
MNAIDAIIEELAIIANKLRALDYGLHAGMIRLVRDDLVEIQRAEDALFDRPDLVLDVLLGSLDGGGLGPNGKRKQ